MKLAVGLRFLMDLRGKAGNFMEQRYTFCCRGGGSGRLEGKVALITGGATGLGKATAHKFIRQGAKVVIADIDANLGPQAAVDLGSEAKFIPCDVSNERQVADAVDFTMAQHGKLDIMYNNAGIAGPTLATSIVDLNLDDFDRVMAINIRGCIAGVKHAARVMVPAASGCILCTASIGGVMGGLAGHPYTTSKFAVPGIVKSAASELSQHGIRINCISPCAIPTQLVVDQMAALFPKAGVDQITAIVHGFGELSRAKCEEEDIAWAAVYLVSDEAKYVSGHNLVVDGGFTSYKSLRLPVSD